MKKSFLYIAVLLVVILLLPSCIGNRGGGPTLNVTDPTLPAMTQSVTEPVTQQAVTETTTELTQPPEMTFPTETQSVADDEEVMLVSADPQNPYLNAVVQKYGLDPATLVAFYASSMKTDGNLVFEFDGSVGSNGKPVRTTKTLINIYTVDENLVAKKATGKASEGNEYSKRDSLYCEYFVKWVVFKIYAKDIQNA